MARNLTLQLRREVRRHRVTGERARAGVQWREVLRGTARSRKRRHNGQSRRNYGLWSTGHDRAKCAHLIHLKKYNHGKFKSSRNVALWTNYLWCLHWGHAGERCGYRLGRRWDGNGRQRLWCALEHGGGVVQHGVNQLLEFGGSETERAIIGEQHPRARGGLCWTVNIRGELLQLLDKVVHGFGRKLRHLARVFLALRRHERRTATLQVESHFLEERLLQNIRMSP